MKGLTEVDNYIIDDWLNEYWLSTSNDDYRFAYLGGDSTFTPLHADVYRYIKRADCIQSHKLMLVC